MDSGAVIYVPSFIKIGSGIQKLIGGGTHAQTATCCHKPTIFFQNKESRLKRSIARNVVGLYYVNDTHTIQIYSIYLNDGFEVFKAVTMKNIIIRDVTPCSLVEFYRCFGGAYCTYRPLLIIYLLGLIFEPEVGGSTVNLLV
jgi:hypothetical protein